MYKKALAIFLVFLISIGFAEENATNGGIEEGVGNYADNLLNYFSIVDLATLAAILIGIVMLFLWKDKLFWITVVIYVILILKFRGYF